MLMTLSLKEHVLASDRNGIVPMSVVFQNLWQSPGWFGRMKNAGNTYRTYSRVWGKKT